MPNLNTEPLKKCTYLWKLVDFGLHQGGVKLSISSSIFHFKTIQKTRWRLHLVNDEDVVNKVKLEITRLRNTETTYELKEIIAIVTFKILHESDICVMKCSDEISFSVSQKYTVKDFFDRTSICEHLIDNTLTVILELELSPKMCNKTVNYNNDCEMFSLDMQMLYETELYSDVIIYTTDNRLKAHRAILEARWPGIVHLITTGVYSSFLLLPFSSSVLTSVLKYVYTGKLEFENLPPEFYVISNLYNFNLNELLLKSQSILDEIICETCFNTSNANINCSLNEIMNMELNSLPFKSEIPVKNLVLKIEVLKDPENKDDIQLILKFPDFNPDDPFHVSCTMSIFADDDLVASKEDDQVIVNDLSWKFPSFFQISELSLCNLLKKELKLVCHCNFTSVTHTTQHIDTYKKIEEREKTLEDRLRLNNDISNLLGNTMNSDLEIICGEHHYYAHRSILSCRSPKFREMIEECTSDKKVIYVTDILPDMLLLLLQYMYGTLLEDEIFDLFSCDLYPASLIYEVKSLADKCEVRVFPNSTVL